MLNEKRQRMPSVSSIMDPSLILAFCLLQKFSYNDAGVMESPAKENSSIHASCWRKIVPPWHLDCPLSAVITAIYALSLALNPDTLGPGKRFLLHELWELMRLPSSGPMKSENHFFVREEPQARFRSKSQGIILFLERNLTVKSELAMWPWG